MSSKFLSLKNRTMFLVVFLIVLSNSLFSQITITNRAGADVTNSGSVLTDYLHVVLTSPENYPTQTYQLFEGNNEPSWGGITVSDFYEDLYFYKKELVDQWIRIEVNDGATATVKVIELQKGIITTQLDDPVLPVDYAEGMGTGLIVEAKTFAANTEAEISKTCYDMKKAGIHHVRAHIDRLTKDKLSENFPISAADPFYFNQLDLWVKYMMRNGLYLHVGNSAVSMLELTMAQDNPAYLGGYAQEMAD